MKAYYFAILAACVWGVVPAIEKMGLAKVDPYVGLFYRCFGVLFGILILGLFVIKNPEVKNVPLKSIGLLVLGGFLASFVAQIAFYHALKIGDVSKIVPVTASYMLVASLMGIIFLKEPITLQKVLGTVLIFGGIWVLK
jgi:bacterial/archaeal transporter family protein